MFSLPHLKNITIVFQKMTGDDGRVNNEWTAVVLYEMLLEMKRMVQGFTLRLYVRLHGGVKAYEEFEWNNVRHGIKGLPMLKAIFFRVSNSS